MKLLQILYPGLGGHSSVATSLINGDNNEFFEHYLLGYGIEAPSDNLDSYNCDFVKKKQGFDLSSYQKVFRKIRKLQPNAIIVHSTSQVITVFVYSLFYRIKWLAVEHQSNNAKSKLDWLYSVVILLLAPRIVYLTESYKDQMLLKFPYLARNKQISVIGNGIDLNKFTPGNKMTDGPIQISMISRLNKLRDHKTLINAFAMIACSNDNLRLVIAGDGETFEEIQDYILHLNLQDRVSLPGFLNEHQVIRLLHDTDIYVHSSLAETQSTSLLQVMACKIPIIATDIDGISSLLSHGKEALLFECFDKKVLVDNINRVINSQALRSLLKENAYIKLKNNFSSIDMFIKYFNFINE